MNSKTDSSAVSSSTNADSTPKLNYDVPEKPREYAVKMRNETRAYSDIATQIGLKPQ